MQEKMQCDAAVVVTGSTVIRIRIGKPTLVIAIVMEQCPCVTLHATVTNLLRSPYSLAATN